jgi:hypothetical protein
MTASRLAKNESSDLEEENAILGSGNGGDGGVIVDLIVVANVDSYH